MLRGNFWPAKLPKGYRLSALFFLTKATDELLPQTSDLAQSDISGRDMTSKSMALFIDDAGALHSVLDLTLAVTPATLWSNPSVSLLSAVLFLSNMSRVDNTLMLFSPPVRVTGEMRFPAFVSDDPNNPPSRFLPVLLRWAQCWLHSLYCRYVSRLRVLHRWPCHNPQTYQRLDWSSQRYQGSCIRLRPTTGRDQLPSRWLWSHWRSRSRSHGLGQTTRGYQWCHWSLSKVCWRLPYIHIQIPTTPTLQRVRVDIELPEDKVGALQEGRRRNVQGSAWKAHFVHQYASHYLPDKRTHGIRGGRKEQSHGRKGSGGEQGQLYSYITGELIDRTTPMLWNSDASE